MVMLVDTHSHIDMLKEISIEDALQAAKEAGVDKMLNPTAYAGDLEKVYDLATKYENIYGMLGVHPSEIDGWTEDLPDKIRELAKSDKIVAIGEIGLDYHWDKSNVERQKEIFIKQIKLANELGLPISVHERDAHKDCFDILKQHNKGSEIVLHCFSGSAEFARECLKEGWYIALGGVVTFKNAPKTKEVAKVVPLDRLLVETDAPYLAPTPFRGSENQPAYVKLVAEEVARLKEVSFEEVATATTNNAIKIFNL